jgi:hypothetical protein
MRVLAPKVQSSGAFQAMGAGATTGNRIINLFVVGKESPANNNYVASYQICQIERHMPCHTNFNDSKMQCDCLPAWLPAPKLLADDSSFWHKSLIPGHHVARAESVRPPLSVPCCGDKKK